MSKKCNTEEGELGVWRMKAVGGCEVVTREGALLSDVTDRTGG